MSDFKKWFEKTQHVQYPGVPWESMHIVMMRLADAVAEYVDKEVERLRAGEEKHAMSDWQPIDTAPEKGCFLVWQEKGGIGIACVGDHFGEKRFYDGDGLDSGNYVRWHPSHWMPLPDPPKP